MAQIGAKQLVMGFLSLTESQADRVQPFLPDSLLRKVGSSRLDRSMTGVTYALSMQQSFFLIFDSDYEGRAVVQKTYWGEDTDTIYDMVKAEAVPFMQYPGSTGFFIYSSQLGYLLVEKQILEGKKCISVSCECVL